MSVLTHVSTFGRKTSLVENREFDSLVYKLSTYSSQSIFFCNVHMLMLSLEDEGLATAMDNADWVFADGVPISWLQRRISGKDAKVIRGYEIMQAVCDHAARAGEKVGFIGSTEEVLKCLASRLIGKYEGLTVVYQFSPPFVAGDLYTAPEELQSIKDSEVKWLFVGLGCPKQEKWIENYKDKLNCNLLGVGAAFEWLSGKVSMPPRWMERFGLAWLYRLLSNPLKMWRRYIIYNTKFLFRVLKM